MRDSPVPAPAASNPLPRLLSIRVVADLTGLSRGAIYKLAARGDFPRPRLVASRTSRWRADEVAAWIDSRPVSTLRSPNPRSAATVGSEPRSRIRSIPGCE